MTPAIDWTEFHRKALARPSRELLRRTLGCFELEGRPPGVAVDLGCGAGTESLEMLRRGWRVHAVDAGAEGMAMLSSLAAQGSDADCPQLSTHVMNFETFEFPPCDLIWAGYSLPFCSREQWPALWQRMRAALRPNGRIAGDVFGDKHAWAAEPHLHIVSEQTLRSELQGLVIEAFDVEDGIRPSSGRLTRWHSFGIAVKKPGG